MKRSPCTRMTGLAVAANRKGLAAGAVRRNQAAVRIMAVDTSGMRFGGSAPQGVVMAAGADGGGHLDKRAVIRRYRRMRRRPTRGMTGLAVAAIGKSLAAGAVRRNQAAVNIMAAGAAVMGCRIDERIGVTG